MKKKFWIGILTAVLLLNLLPGDDAVGGGGRYVIDGD